MQGRGASWIAEESRLLQAVIEMSSHLDLRSVLTRFVHIAAEFTGARGTAISVLDARGVTETFIAFSVDDAGRDAIESLQNSQAVLGLMRSDEPLLLEDATGALGGVCGAGAGGAGVGGAGFRSEHPALGSLLGVPVRVRHMVFAHLYMVNKPGGFARSDAEVIMALAAAVGVAIENAQLYQAAQRRELWLAAGQEITTMMLSGADEEEALVTIAKRAREVARADACVLVLPSVGGRLVIEIADGVAADDLIGTVMPRDGRSHTVLAEGIGMIVDSFSNAFTLRVALLRQFGPALYAPMSTGGRGIGVMLLLREDGGAYFDQADLMTAESFASQAAVVLVLGEARHADDVKSLFDERERIARDLHDLAIQQLFATGMRLETARRQATTGVNPEELEAILSDSLDNIDSAVREIRSIIHDLRDPDADAGLAERLRREASLARAGLGFAPSLVILVDGEALDAPGSAPALDAELARLVSADLADDVVAVAREGLANAARHAKAASVKVTVQVTRPAPPHPAIPPVPAIPPGPAGQPVPAAPPSPPIPAVRTVPDSPASRAGAVRVTVSDDGRGFPPGETRRSGLANLEARARRHLGALEVRPNAERPGTTLLWQVRL
jgi:signal transduction histidine kinase